MSDDLMNTDEAAEFLHVEPGTLRTYRSRGFGPRVTEIAGKKFYRRRDLLNYLAYRRF